MCLKQAVRNNSDEKNMVVYDWAKPRSNCTEAEIAFAARIHGFPPLFPQYLIGSLATQSIYVQHSWKKMNVKRFKQGCQLSDLGGQCTRA